MIHVDESTTARRERRSPSPMAIAAQPHRVVDDDVLQDAFTLSALRGVRVNGGASSIVV